MEIVFCAMDPVNTLRIDIWETFEIVFNRKAVDQIIHKHWSFSITNRADSFLRDNIQIFISNPEGIRIDIPLSVVARDRWSGFIQIDLLSFTLFSQSFDRGAIPQRVHSTLFSNLILNWVTIYGSVPSPAPFSDLLLSNLKRRILVPHHYYTQFREVSP